jgi:hypothetical protein
MPCALLSPEPSDEQAEPIIATHAAATAVPTKPKLVFMLPLAPR